MLKHGEWEDAKRIFEAALDVDPSERDAYVRRSTAGDRALLEEVQSLLAWHEPSGDFLDIPIARVPDVAGLPAGSLIGQNLGVWRITDVIGRGGMGMVYRAERADDAFWREAAVKVVSRGAMTPEMIGRFRRERETLASLDHPNIARVLDGGSTPAGEPYLVMEYVDGERVDAYCDTHRLSVDERLPLFRTICKAVGAAHQRLIVHRDLKPDNILVNVEGTPKLLDFGIAALLSQPETQPLDGMSHATWLMTPEFASPEQMAGGVASTATDVYALGVLLHVLLTGEPPYVLKERSAERLREELSRSTLRSPSLRVGEDSPENRVRAAARRTTPRQLAGALRGDLDAIVRKALCRDVGSRYQSVDDLLEDLERHRTHWPVTARPPSSIYFARRFVRRNRVAVALVAVVVCTLAAGVVGVLWQAARAAEAQARAERRFNDVRQLAHAFIFDVHDQIANLPGSTRGRELLVRTGSEYLETLSRESGGDLGLQRQLAAAFVKLGDAQGHPNAPNIGDTAAARRSYDQAITLATAVLAAQPEDLEAQRTMAMAHRKQADVLAWSGHMQEAARCSERSLTLFLAVSSRPDATPDDRFQRAIADIKFGDLLGNPNFPNLGRAADALPHYESALGLLRTESATAPSDIRLRRYLGLTLERLGTLHEAAGRVPDATAAYTESFTIRQALAAEAPLHTDIQRDLAIALEKVGNVKAFSGDLKGSLASHRAALAQFERLFQADRANATAERSVAISRENVAAALMRLQRHAEARTELQTALATHEKLAASDPVSTQLRCDVARVHEMVGDATEGLQACRSWSESLKARESLASTDAWCAAKPHLERLSARLLQCK